MVKIALRCALIAVLAACLYKPALAKADTVEHLMIPSPSMGRDIQVTFQPGGPHAVYLLDAFNAAGDVSNWVTAGNAMSTLGGKGISVVAPAGGAWSLYTDWEQDPSKQWETFLSQELPDWLVAHKGLAPGGHGIVGASQGGTAAMTLAEFHPDRFRYAGSMSGFLTPSATTLNGAITSALAAYGRVNTQDMWGPAQYGRWTCTDPAAMIGYCDQAQGTNRLFYTHLLAQGATNTHIDINATGQHDWPTWNAQLKTMAADLAANIK
ncbi:alpha/beta hydrolase [Mycobacteroides abscessus]|uniref:alpha/beta hydrolase n=1 Tax=Mycobacteroides abscessus TaxID=36809 RepID=UPI0009418CD0